MPLLKQLGTWMQDKYSEVLPKCVIGIALAYSIKRWDKFSQKRMHMSESSLMMMGSKLKLEQKYISQLLKDIVCVTENYITCELFSSSISHPRTKLHIKNLYQH